MLYPILTSGILTASLALGLGLAMPALAEPPEGTSSLLNKLTAQQWQEDLDHLARQILLRHPNPFHYGPTEADNHSAWQDLRQEIPKLPWRGVVLELRRFVVSLGDDHTGAAGDTFDTLKQDRWYPVMFSVGPNGLYVVEAAPEYQDLLGARLVAMEDHSADEVYARLLPYCSGDNEFSQRLAAPSFLRQPAVIEYLELAEEVDPLLCTFQTFEGQEEDVLLVPLPKEELQDLVRLEDLWVCTVSSSPVRLLCRPKRQTAW